MHPATPTLVLVNPTSGSGRSLRVLPKIREFLQKMCSHAEFVITRSADDLRARAAAAASQGYRCVAALGGDGTFHYVLAGALGSDVSLAFFPAGGGNDIAECLGIPTDPIESVVAFLKGAPRSIDVLRANFAGEPAQVFIGAGGLGIDADAAQLASTRFRHWPGAARYLVAATRALSNFKLLRVKASVDGAHVSGPATLFAVANSSSYGSGVKIAPKAQMDDGWMDLTLVGEITWMRILEAIPIILRNGNLPWPEIRRYVARRVWISTDRRALFHGDGELLGEVSADAPVEVEVLPAAAHVVAPQ